MKRTVAVILLDGAPTFAQGRPVANQDGDETQARAARGLGFETKLPR